MGDANSVKLTGGQKSSCMSTTNNAGLNFDGLPDVVIVESILYRLDRYQEIVYVEISNPGQPGPKSVFRLAAKSKKVKRDVLVMK